MNLEEFEDRLDSVLAEVDRDLEDKWGHVLPIHPSRPKAGETANPQYDGLFRVTSVFTAGFGSEKGPGYVFRVEFATLASVPQAVRSQIEERAVERLRAGLLEAFPGRDLKVERDGACYKIYGDLSLK